jgi:hypothetical protein
MSSGAAAPVAPEPTGPLPTSSLLSIERVVTLLAPLFAAGATWLSGLVASNVPWAPQLSPTGIEGVMIAAFLGTIAVVIKWLHGRQIPAIAALSPIKVTQHTLDTLYAEIEAYLASNAHTFQGPKGEPGLSTADIEQIVTGLVGHLNEQTVQAWIAKEVSSRFSAAAGGGSTIAGAGQAPGPATA